MQKFRQALKHYDFLLAFVTIALSVFGVVMIYASVNADAIPPSITARWYWLWERQLLYVVSGALLMFVFSVIDYHWFTRFYLYVYGLMIVLLVVVMFIGASEPGVSRWLWIRLPVVGALSMQPSEFAKLFMILFLAKFLDLGKDRFNRPLWLILVLMLIAVPVAMVAVQPSFSASMVILSLSMVILFVGGLYYRTILVGLAMLSPIAAMTWLDVQRAYPIFLNRVLADWQIQRITTMIDPIPGSDAFMQTEGSLFAIGSGGLTGKGFLNNTYVILGQNDFIFSVVAEQFGFIGATALLAIVAFMIARCTLIALRAGDMEGRLIAAGVAGMLIFETFFHVGVVTNLLPNTGVPFPFMSYGGSMIWVHMIAMGIVLNVGLPRTKSMFDIDDDDDEVAL